MSIVLGARVILEDFHDLDRRRKIFQQLTEKLGSESTIEELDDLIGLAGCLAEYAETDHVCLSMQVMAARAELYKFLQLYPEIRSLNPVTPYITLVRRHGDSGDALLLCEVELALMGTDEE